MVASSCRREVRGGLKVLPACTLAVASSLIVGAARGEPFSARVVFGVGEDPPGQWSGSIRAEGASISKLDGWLIGDDDRIDLNAFHFGTAHPVRPEPVRKGFLVEGDAEPGASIEVSTNHGGFSFGLDQPSPVDGHRFLSGWAQALVLPSTEQLTDNSRFDDYPSVAVGPDGTAWVVWQSYSGGRDEVRIRKLDGNWGTFSRVPGMSGDVWRPQVALDASHRPWVVWSEQMDGNFDIFARTLDEESGRWEGLVRLSSRPQPDINHHLVADARGWLWVVWQGFQDQNSDIFLRYFDGTHWSGEIHVSGHPASDWEPRVAVDRLGTAFVVWDSYQNGNYDVFLRPFSRGELGPLTAVAATPKFEAHASVAVDLDGRVWVAWDEGAPNWGKDSGPTVDPDWISRGRELWTSWIDQPSKPGARLYESRKINLCVFDGAIRKLPKADLQAALARAGIPDHDFPQLRVDPASGRVAVLFHSWNHVRWTESLGFRPSYWEHSVVHYEGDRWSPVQTMPRSWGRISARADAAFGRDGSLRVVWTTDGRLERRPVREVTANILTARLGPAAGPVTLALDRSPPPTPVRSDPVHPSEKEDVAFMRSYRTAIRGKEHRVARGDLHRHTEFSWDSSGGMVDGSVMDFYRYMIDAAAMDFGAVTDHNAGGDSEYWWWLTQKTADLFHVPGAFTTLYGYERSVEYPNGHRNVFHANRGVPVVSFFTQPGFSRPRPLVAASQGTLLENDTELLFESLRRTGGISIPHTPGSNMGTDWSASDREVEPVVEVFQGDRVSYEHPGAPRAPRSADDRPIGGFREDGFVWNALRKGHRLGMIASSDHWSTHISYAMVFTESPTRAAILDAIRKRRTYGATDNILLEYRMNEHFMGDAFSSEAVPPLAIYAMGTSEIAAIEVVRNGEIVFSGRPGQRDLALTFTDSDPPPGDLYYYVRIVQDDRGIAWGSPIWIERSDGPAATPD